MSLDFSALDTNQMRTVHGHLVATLVDVTLPCSPCGYLNFNNATGAALRNLLGLRAQYGTMRIGGMRKRINAAQEQFDERTPGALRAREAAGRLISSTSRGARVVDLKQKFGAADLEQRLVSLEEFVIAAEKAGATEISWT